MSFKSNSFNSSTSSIKTNKPLEAETIIFGEHMKEFLEANINIRPAIGKDVEYSLYYLDLAKHHRDQLDYVVAWEYYTKSIVAAPDDSKQLAVCYIKRAELLYSFSKFNDCLSDCDCAINVSECPEVFKAIPLKLKIMCLKMLKDNKLKDTIDAAREYLKNLQESEAEDVADHHDVKKLKVLLEFQSDNDENVEQPKFKESETKEYPAFERQDEFAGASKSIRMEYSKNWGRHIVAARDIEPGEILVIEKSHFANRRMDRMYPFCFICMKPAWALIPCVQCIYDVYCSEQCKAEAWKKYHRFECDILPYLCKLDEPVRKSVLCLRFMLIAIHSAGGIDELKKELSYIEECEDVREKGFTYKIFDTSNARSIYSLSSEDVNLSDAKDKKINLRQKRMSLKSQIKFCCFAIYYLSVYTDFFGVTSESSYEKVGNDENLDFVGALLLRTLRMLPRNYFTFDVYNPESSLHKLNHVKRYGVSLYPYCSFFNHSCCPNALYFTTENNELFVFAKHLIKQGSQIFISYCNYEHISARRVARIDFLLRTYDFMCKCEACQKDWPLRPALKNIMDLIKYVDGKSVNDVCTLLKKVKEDHGNQNYISEVVDALKLLCEKGLYAQCSDYENLISKIFNTYITQYGNNIISAFNPYLQ